MANATPVHSAPKKKPLSKDAEKIKAELETPVEDKPEAPVEPSTLPDGTVVTNY